METKTLFFDFKEDILFCPFAAPDKDGNDSTNSQLSPSLEDLNKLPTPPPQ